MAVTDYDPIIAEAANEWNVDPHIIRALMQQESGGNRVDAQGRPIRSRVGAGGLMQIMPQTAERLGILNVDDPVQNIFGGAKYVSQLLDRYKDTKNPTAAAVAAYNAGPGRVDTWLAGKGSLPAETQSFLPSVSAHYQKFSGGAPVPKAAADVQNSAPKPPTGADFLKSVGATSTAPPSAQSAADRGAEFLKSVGVAPKPTAPESPDVGQDYAGPTSGFASSPGVAAVKQVAQAATDAQNNPQRFAGGSEYGDLSSQPWNVGGGPTVDYAPAARVGQAVGRAVADTYANTPNPLMSPEFQSVIESGGPVGRYITSPLLQAGGAALRGAGALGAGLAAGIGETATQAGVPALGRDVNALMQVAPVAMAGAPLTAGWDAPHPDAQIPMVKPRISVRADSREVPSPLAAPSPEGVPLRAPEPVAAAPAAEAPQGAPVTQSVGAAASREQTPQSQIDLSPAEMKANRRQAEKATLLAPPEANDTTIYVPDSLPTRAEYTGNPTVSQEESLLRQRNPDAFETRLSANNEARVKYYDDATPSDTQLQRMEDARSVQAEKDTQEILANAKPANAQPVLDTLDEILNDKRNQNRQSVQSNLSAYRDRLFDADGNLKTDPQELWGIRDDLTEKLDKIGKDPQSTMGYVKKEALAVRNAIDDVLQTATNGKFQQFLDNYAQASQQINAGDLLREFRDKLTNAKGTIQADRFHRFVVDLAERRGDRGIDPAMDIPDETMQKLMAINADLKRAGLIDLGKARGSPTNLYGELAKNMGLAGAHAAVASVSPGVGNLVLQRGLDLGVPIVGKWQLDKRTRQHLAPPEGGYRNPLETP